MSLLARQAAVLTAAVVTLFACAPPTPSGTATPAVMPGSTPAEGRELTADQQVAQALNRLTFGPRPGDATRVRAMGVDRWIASQLRPERIDDRAAEQVVDRLEMLRAEPRELVGLFTRVRQARREAARTDTASRAESRREAMAADPDLRTAARRLQRGVSDLQTARLARAVVSERQLDEVMVDFWENHFSVFAGKGQTRLFLTQYDRDVIRPHALGKFRDLLGAVAKSPAMLFYLDNWRSAADSTHATLGTRGARLDRRRRPDLARAPRPAPPGSPTAAPPRRPARGLNENYARELLELHTLGVDGGYTQQDVIEVARALSGWSIDPRTGEFTFRPGAHDADEKVVLGHVLRAGRGIEDGEEVLDIVAQHPATARHIARKLVVRFVSDSPPPPLVARAAETFRRTDGDIREVVRTIVTSPEFFSHAAYRAKVKTPFELVTSALRALNTEPDTTPRTAQIVARLGQPIFGRQTPDGWPETGESWMNAGAILSRINFGLALAGGRLPGGGLGRWPQAAALSAAPREDQVEGVVRAILAGEASPETWAILRSGENPLATRLAPADTVAAAAITAPGRETGDASVDRRMRRVAGPLGRPVALEGLPQLVGLALGAPEFQRK